MGDQNRNRVHSKLVDFSLQSLRGEVATYVSKLLQPVGKRGFEDNRRDLLVFACNGPNLLRWSGIADVEQQRFFISDEESDARYDVIVAVCGHRISPDYRSSPLGHSAKPH